MSVQWSPLERLGFVTAAAQVLGCELSSARALGVLVEAAGSPVPTRRLGEFIGRRGLPVSKEGVHQHVLRLRRVLRRRGLEIAGPRRIGGYLLASDAAADIVREVTTALVAEAAVRA